ncbi:MAG TPA: hypothetical protein DCS63_02470 [Elusimicrobia bacterium]|nr:hypothetical protein [Elusimicrobiota bacterium]
MNKNLLLSLLPVLMAPLLLSCRKPEPQWVTPSGETVAVSLAGGEQDAAGVGPAAGEPAPVETEAVRITDLETSLNASGNIIPWESMLLSAKMPGKIGTAPVEEGAQAAKGAVIAELETQDLSIELAKARTEAAGARARYKRIKKLYDASAATITQFESAESAYKGAASALSSLDEKMASARITAPFAGIVSKKLVSPGSVVNAGQPVAELVDISRVKIDAGFSEIEAKHIEKGRKAQISVDAFPDQKFEGEVDYVGSVVDPLTRTFSAKIAIDNKANLLKAGMSARVRIVTGTYPGALTVPVGALLREGEKSYVFAVEKAGEGAALIARKREVEAGIPGRDVVQLRSGLRKDEVVVVRGMEKLSDGARVRIVNDHR